MLPQDAGGADDDAATAATASVDAEESAEYVAAVASDAEDDAADPVDVDPTDVVDIAAKADATKGPWDKRLRLSLGSILGSIDKDSAFLKDARSNRMKPCSPFHGANKGVSNFSMFLKYHK